MFWDFWAENNAKKIRSAIFNPLTISLFGFDIDIEGIRCVKYQ